MTSMTVPEAQANLPEIVENLPPGDEVVLTRNEEPIAKLIPFSTLKPQPVFGNCRGKLIIVAEDDEHLQDFSDYMPCSADDAAVSSPQPVRSVVGGSGNGRADHGS